MAELDFERRLERMLSQSPELPDAEAFALRIEGRLDRGWNMRRWVIGAAGLVGGLVGASQLIVSNVVGRVEDASAGSSKFIQAGIAQVRPSLDALAFAQSDLLMVWVAVGVAIVAMGFALTRVIAEI
jgi:hypothetical protein